MEGINNNVNNESVPPVIEIPPKENKTFKVLFVISVLVVIGLLAVIYFLLQNSKKINITETSNQIEETITPTIIETAVSQQTTPTAEKSKTYEAVSVQDDKNSVAKLILKDNQGNETIISESKYWKMSDTLTAKPGYTNFIFSPNNNFLYYYHDSGWEGGSSFLYDIKNKKLIDLEIMADIKGFSPDSKYFYACAEGGMASGGAIIKELGSLGNIFISNNQEDSYKCEYNKDVGELILSELDTRTPGEEKISSQYKFSEKTGSLTKIK